MAFDQLQPLLGVEALHDHGRRAEAQRAGDARLRRGVIQRRGRQVHHVLVELPHEPQPRERGQRFAGVLFRQRAEDALRLPGGSRRV